VNKTHMICQAKLVSIQKYTFTYEYMGSVKKVQKSVTYYWNGPLCFWATILTHINSQACVQRPPLGMWPLLTCSCCSKYYCLLNWDSKMVVAVGRWSLGRSGLNVVHSFFSQKLSIKIFCRNHETGFKTGLVLSTRRSGAETVSRFWTKFSS